MITSLACHQLLNYKQVTGFKVFFFWLDCAYHLPDFMILPFYKWHFYQPTSSHL